MKYVSILSDLDDLELKIVPDELYDRIVLYVNPTNYTFPKFQVLYDNLCKSVPDQLGEQLWNELNDCENVDCELIQVY